LADIEEHLGVTIDQVDTSLQVTANEFDGKVTYGQKRSNTGNAGSINSLKCSVVKQLHFKVFNAIQV